MLNKASQLREFHILNNNSQSFTIKVKGRDRWALECLIKAGKAGCTPIDYPAPRWSAYVFNLRGLKVQIETVHERHEGAFAGNHARYVLRSMAQPVKTEGVNR